MIRRPPRFTRTDPLCPYTTLFRSGLDEYARLALLRRELANNRPLGTPFFEYSERTASELAIVHAAAEAHRIYGPQCITHYIISKAESVSDLLEVNIILKEIGRAHV